MAVFLPVVGQWAPVSAHPGRTDSAGCHTCRTNCPRWGLSYGEYHCHGGGGGYDPDPEPVYIPRCTLPALGEQGKWEFAADGCAQDVTFTWDKGTGDSWYSVGLSKVAGADPGPRSDTTTPRIEFDKVQPGKWYINVKAGNSCGWTNVAYWEVDVPVVHPTASLREEVISNDERKLHYQTECADSYTLAPSVGTLDKASGEVTIHPQTNQEYTLTARKKNDFTTASVQVYYPLNSPSPSPTETPAATPATDDDSEGSDFWLIPAGALGWAAYALIKKPTPKA